jgi:hypothetical protein
MVSVHLLDGSTVAGRVARCTRGYVHLVEHRVEANGVMHELASQRMLVPMDRVKLVEVVQA